MVTFNRGDTANRKFINPGVLDPCQKPRGPHPGCPQSESMPVERTPANPYSRGCSKLTRCRSL